MLNKYAMKFPTKTFFGNKLKYKEIKCAYRYYMAIKRAHSVRFTVEKVKKVLSETRKCATRQGQAKLFGDRLIIETLQTNAEPV